MMDSHMHPLNLGVKVDSVDYKIEAKIGYGGNADVYKCIDEASGNEYAIKFQRNVKSDRLNRFKKEIILKLCIFFKAISTNKF
jgi:serine/threonine protein kinase